MKQMKDSLDKAATCEVDPNDVREWSDALKRSCDKPGLDLHNDVCDLLSDHESDIIAYASAFSIVESKDKSDKEHTSACKSLFLTLRGCLDKLLAFSDCHRATLMDHRVEDVTVKPAKVEEMEAVVEEEGVEPVSPDDEEPPPEIAKEKLEVDSDNSDEPPEMVALALIRSLMKLLAQFDTPDAELYKEGYTRACLHEKAYELSKKTYSLDVCHKWSDLWSQHNATPQSQSRIEAPNPGFRVQQWVDKAASSDRLIHYISLCLVGGIENGGPDCDIVMREVLEKNIFVPVCVFDAAKAFKQLETLLATAVSIKKGAAVTLADAAVILGDAGRAAKFVPKAFDSQPDLATARASLMAYITTLLAAFERRMRHNETILKTFHEKYGKITDAIEAWDFSTTPWVHAKHQKKEGIEESVLKIVEIAAMQKDNWKATIEEVAKHKDVLDATPRQQVDELFQKHGERASLVDKCARVLALNIMTEKVLLPDTNEKSAIVSKWSSWCKARLLTEVSAMPDKMQNAISSADGKGKGKKKGAARTETESQKQESPKKKARVASPKKLGLKKMKK